MFFFTSQANKKIIRTVLLRNNCQKKHELCSEKGGHIIPLKQEYIFQCDSWC